MENAPFQPEALVRSAKPRNAEKWRAENLKFGPSFPYPLEASESRFKIEYSRRKSQKSDRFGLLT
jgi:hypothetical protein